MTTTARYRLASEQLSYNAESGKFHWRLDLPHRGIQAGDSAGFLDAWGYLRVKISCKTLPLHKLAWYLTHGEIPKSLKHLDGNRVNNRMANLFKRA